MSSKALPHQDPTVRRDEPAKPKDRSADREPAIRDMEDLERVTSDRKPTADPQELSQEARKQIARKLRPKKAA